MHHLPHRCEDILDHPHMLNRHRIIRELGAEIVQYFTEDILDDTDNPRKVRCSSIVKRV